MKRKTLICGILIALALFAAPVTAREGLYLGAYYPKTSWSGDVQGLESGTGLGARAGLGFGRYIGIEGSLFKTVHDAGINPTVDFKGGTVDLKIFFPLTYSQLEPYIHGGIGRYYLENMLVNFPFQTAEFRGDGNQYGVGVNLYLFPELSLNAGYTKRNITFDSGTPAGVSRKGKARTIDFGISYHFL